MSAEIKMSGFSYTIAKGSMSYAKTFPSQQFDMSGTDYSAGVQSIPTTAGGTAVAVAAAVGTYGYAHFTNLDSSNYVDLGVQVSGTFYPFMRVMPGKTSPPILLSMAAGALYALAHTAAVELEVFVNEA